MSSDAVNNRKIQHIEIIQSDKAVDRRKNYFDLIQLSHRALPELNLADVDASCTFMGKELSFPLLISSMTGGDHVVVETINRNLALAAEATQVAMGVGSQRVMFTNQEARKSFAIRAHAPTTLLFGNLGAVQLNYGFGIQHCREAIEVLEADGLYLHLNPLQEAVQPEGDTNFSGLAEKIAAIAQTLEQPVILKEVGSGFSEVDANRSIDMGIQYIDVAGAGGTSWSRIEHHRKGAPDDEIGLVYQDWGIPTPQALQQLAPYRNQLTLIASGGLRSGLDMLKSVILGARLCGLAAPFLQPAMESPEAVIQVIERLRREFRTGMFLLGCKNLEALETSPELIRSS
ncbi:MAG: isopentenyl-diphosphate delta-isomerase [Kiritimatiellia bacterium]|jgi:isopentenyl-diphosphate delta-isomerase